MSCIVVSCVRYPQPFIITAMSDPLCLVPPSKPRHYIIVVHGIGDQKLSETLPPVVNRFAEVRQGRKENFFDIVLPATLSSHSVRSETDMHGWTEFRGIPVDDNGCYEDFDGTAPTESAGENFRFVELYWQDILRRHHNKVASKTDVWAKAMLAKLHDPSITPQDWLPSWVLPMLRSIVNVAVPLKTIIGFKNKDLSEHVFEDFLGDVHLYGDYARTRGESVRHFHAVLEKIVLFDFLDWRIRELTVAKINHEKIKYNGYQKPKISIIAHSLGSIMSFDALVYAFARKNIRSSSSESAAFPSSLPFLGYLTSSEEEKQCWKQHEERLNRYKKDIRFRIFDEAIEDCCIPSLKIIFFEIICDLVDKRYSLIMVKEFVDKLSKSLNTVFSCSVWFNEMIDYVFSCKEQPRERFFDRLLSFPEESAGLVENNIGFDFCTVDDFKDKVREKHKSYFENICAFISQEFGLNDKLLQLINAHNLNCNDSVIQKKYCELKKRDRDYWKQFLNGFSDRISDENNLLVMGKNGLPEFKENIASSVPVLLWRDCVKHFITIGSPIDKYIAMWHQNYVHMGLRIKDYTTPPRWIDSRYECYDYPVKKIKHYNFCDEQDPVGHHLDLTRATAVYENIFDIADAGKRDIVFRRYGIPGLAHLKYWEDGELFRGILREIIDGSDNNEQKAITSSYFAEKHFRVKKNAEKQGFLWAYFRLPMLVSVITGLLIVYGMYALDGFHLHELNQKSSESNPLTAIIVFLFTSFLWVIPSFLQFYKERANVENVNKSTAKLLFFNVLSPGIFWRLLSAAIDWRRILVLQSQGCNLDDKNMEKRISFQNQNVRFIWWEFLWRWIIRFVGSVILLWALYYFVPNMEVIKTVKALRAVFTPILIAYVLILLFVLVKFFISKKLFDENADKRYD